MILAVPRNAREGRQRTAATRPTADWFRTGMAVSVALLVACSDDDVAVKATVRPLRPAQSRVGSAAVTPSGPPPRKVLPPANPNVLLVVIDTLRFDATSLSPQGRNRTPVLELLARESIHFSRSYSTFDSTPESHFSLLTGMHSGWMTEQDRPEISLPYQLRKRGYRTFGISANGNLSARFSRMLMSFQSYVCLPELWETLPPERRHRYEEALASTLERYEVTNGKWDGALLYSVGPRVLSALERELDRQRPFFGFINLMEPHDPYFPSRAEYDTSSDRDLRPSRFDSDVRHRVLPPEVVDPNTAADQELRERLAKWIWKAGGRPWSTTYDLDRKALALYRRRYHAEVREADRVLGRILDLLEKKGLLDTTIVVVTSDHGESFGEDGLITHSFGNRGDRESTHRVPLIIRFPPAYAFGSHDVPVLTTISDIVPTIYDVVGIDWAPLAAKTLPGNFGKSLLVYIQTGMPPAAGGAPPSTERWAPVSPQEMERHRREAAERLKSLGYIQ